MTAITRVADPAPPTRPSSLRHVDAANVEAMLRRLHPGARVASVAVAARADCGDGLASTADRLTLEVGFVPGHDAGLPSRMILKTRTLHPLLRFGLPAVLSLASASRVAECLPLVGPAARGALFLLVGLYQRWLPHAPDPMYSGEVRFYTEIRPELDIAAPRALGGLFDERSRRFGILMEDLGQRGARFPTATEELPLDTLRDLLASLARMHARFWRSPRLSGELSWVPDRLSGGMFPVFDGIGLELIRYQVEQSAAKAERLRPLGRTVENLWDAMWATQRQLAAGPQTLLHGDTHVGNTYVLPDGTGGFFDFQLAVRGHWAVDVTYLIVTALSAEARRRHERDLLAGYLVELRRGGVRDVPDADEAFRCHRLAALWGLVIGWLITPTVNYGPAITDANVARTAAACVDLDPFELVA